MSNYEEEQGYEGSPLQKIDQLKARVQELEKQIETANHAAILYEIQIQDLRKRLEN